MRRRLAVVIFESGMLATTAWSQTLPLPPNLISADSAAGESFFFESEAREAYFPLANHFVTQKHQSYCGVASIVMVLNALQLPRRRSLSSIPFAPLHKTTCSTHAPTPYCRGTSCSRRA